MGEGTQAQRAVFVRWRISLQPSCGTVCVLKWCWGVWCCVCVCGGGVHPNWDQSGEGSGGSHPPTHPLEQLVLQEGLDHIVGGGEVPGLVDEVDSFEPGWE